MTVSEIKTLLVSVDPNVQRYEHDGAGTADAYTVWYELQPVGCYGDGQEEGTIRFQVDRFTKEEDEALAATLKTPRFSRSPQTGTPTASLRSPKQTRK